MGWASHTDCVLTKGISSELPNGNAGGTRPPVKTDRSATSRATHALSNLSLVFPCFWQEHTNNKAAKLRHQDLVCKRGFNGGMLPTRGTTLTDQYILWPTLAVSPPMWIFPTMQTVGAFFGKSEHGHIVAMAIFAKPKIAHQCSDLNQQASWQSMLRRQ